MTLTGCTGTQIARWNSGALVLLALIPAGIMGQPDSIDTARQAEQLRIQVIRQASAATIGVFSTDGQGGGSGVIITADGFALTNYHVVEPCGMHMHCSLPDGSIHDAVLVGMDPVGDVALIRLLGRDDFPTATIGNSDRIHVGDFCFAVGNPFLLATNFQPSVSWGIVSGTHRYQYPAATLLEYADCIQTDAAINPGNSGGPLFNGSGELIGINGRGSFEKRGRVNVGVGFAISINQINLFWDHLASGRIVDHATLGATVTDRNGTLRIQDILQTSDAWRRGLRYDDEILSLGGRTVATVNEFKNVLGIFPAWWRIPLEYRRDGLTTKIFVRLQSVHSPEELADIVSRRGQQPDEKPGEEKIPGKPEKHGAGQDLPDSVRPFVEERHGYANWFFNRQQTDAIWSAFRQLTGPIPATGKMQLSGHLDDGTPFQIVLVADQSGIRWSDQAKVLDRELDLALQEEPDGSGGMLAALHLWFRMMQLGPEGTGDTWYLGKLPSTFAERNDDVLVCNTDGVQVRYLFAADSRYLTGVELQTAADRDPCEIRFDDYRSVGELSLPHLITVVCGDSFRWDMIVDSIAVDPAP